MKSDLSTEIHAVSIAQGKVDENKYVIIERPDRKSNHLIDTQSVNKIEFCKHNQEESNMHRRKAVEERQPNVRRSDTESDPSNGILSVNIALGKLVKGEHTGIERPDGTIQLT